MKPVAMMGIMQVQDLTGNIEVLLFSKTFDKYSHEIEEDAVVASTEDAVVEAPVEEVAEEAAE